MYSFLEDIRLGVRLCARSPTFAFTLAFLLSLAIGVNVTVFAVVNAVLLKPLPVSDEDRLLRIYGHRTRVVPYENYEIYRDANTTLSDLALSARAPAALQAEGLDIVADVVSVSGNYFQALGVPAALGRTIQPVDDEPGAPGAIMLSDSLWRRYFGADPDVLGQTVRITADIFTIVGVAPRDFIGITFPYAAEAWVAWNSPLSLSVFGGDMVGRARDHVVLTEVQADLSRIAARIPDTQPFAQPGTFSTVTVYPGRFLGPMVHRQVTAVAAILVILSGLVLFAMAVNIGTLMSARLTARRDEMAIRQAVGASRWRLCRQIVTEGLVLSVLGGAGATVFGYVATSAFRRAPLPFSLPPAGGLDPGYDWRVAAFTLSLCAAATLVFSLLPALRLPSIRTATSTATYTSRGASVGVRRAAAVSLQVGLATLLIATALTTMRGASHFLYMDRGFQTDDVWTVRLNATRQGHTVESASDLLDELRTRLESDPRIRTASYAQHVPLTFAWGEHPGPGSRFSGQMEAEAAGGQDTIHVFHNRVSPGHFHTLGIEMLAGRDFDYADGVVPVGIVNETLAQRLWPGDSPLGKRLRNTADDSPWVEVVGLARDSKYSWMGEDPLSFMYMPMTTHEDKAVARLLVKTAASDQESQTLMRDALREVDSELRAGIIQPIETAMDVMLLRFRFLGAATALIGGLALVLGLVGTYGLVSFLALRRTHEIGVRFAVGATPRQVGGVIARPCLACLAWTLGGIGIGIGVGSSVALTRVLGDRLYGGYGVVPTFVEYIVVAALMVCVSLCGAALPVRRAARVDVVCALRNE